MTMPPQNTLEYLPGVPPRRTNGPAIASLVLGLLGCIPLITGLLAVILGIIGLRRSQGPAGSGKGLAIAGLVLGIVSLVGWGLFGSALGYGYVLSRPAAAVAKQFLADVSSGNVNGAMTESAGLTLTQLQASSLQFQQYGTLQSVSLTSFNFNSQFNGPQTVRVGGSATYSGGLKTCSFDLVKQGATFKVAAYQVQ